MRYSVVRSGNIGLRRAVIVVGGLIVALVVVGVIIAIARHDGGSSVASGPTTTVRVTASTTGGPTTTGPTTVPGPATATTAPPAPITLGTSSAYLQPAFQPTLQSTSPPTADCHTIGDTGWTVKACGAADMAGGSRVWLVSSKAQSPANLLQAKVVHWSQGKGAWLVDLAFTTSPAVDFATINVKAADLDGDGKVELVFGYRTAGTGAYLSYDVVTDGNQTGPSVAATRQGLAKGQASVTTGSITDYAAVYPNNEPQCCPPAFAKAVVKYANGSYKATPSGQVPSPGPGQLDL